MKDCTKCGINKPLSEFHNSSRAKDGKFSACKECRNAANRIISSKTDHAAVYRERMARDGDALRQRSREYYQANKDRIKARSLEWSKKNPERKKESRSRHYEQNKDEYLRSASEWAKRNRSRRTEICLAYMKRKRDEDPRSYVATVTARKLLSRILNSTGRNKKGRTFDALGYNKQQFTEHLESLFQDGMSWENHGKWHIDHIIPVSELVRCGVTDPSKINCLSNLRPLWAEDNMAKRDHFELAPPEAGRITRAKTCLRKR